MSVVTHFVSPEWYKTPEGRDVVSSLMHLNSQTRRSFGLLEKPVPPSQYTLEEYPYKVFVSGKSGVGKTSTVAKLTGNDIPATHSETPGIQTAITYWPAKIMNINKLVMFRIQFWDAGENALKKFDHILPACKSQMDGVLFLFSFIDKTSFDDLPHQMSRILDVEDNVCKFVMGTKLDLYSQGEVTQRDIQQFESHWNVPLFSIRNQSTASRSSPRPDLDEVAPVLNYICDELWTRDQILSGRISQKDLMPHRISYC
ncbi:hypothetical protein LSH36_479g00002 [Paralvinella palmiformis]|uniref:Ciliogenesis and planar polarity effector 2 n=1 Tax=Paralvinella palmiformis TaxID=53620 RepID=A0AAD9MYY5_9ANNE|nr:hypothetical protein LSH36_479g00002 [Paralvinella palmiformis]